MEDSNIKNKSGLVKKASKDFIFSVLALVIYNGVLQLLIYPEIELRIGEGAFGTVLYLISAVSIMGAGFGTAASYSRMMAKKNREEKNGDYNVFLLIIAAIFFKTSSPSARDAISGSASFRCGIASSLNRSSSIALKYSPFIHFSFV